VAFAFFLTYSSRGYHREDPRTPPTLAKVRGGLVAWAATVAAVGATGVLVHSVNQADDATISTVLRAGNGSVTAVEVHPDTDPRYARYVTGRLVQQSPHTIRFFILRDLLETHPCTYCLITDAADVEFRHNPFAGMRDADAARGHHLLYAGDEVVARQFQFDWLTQQMERCFSGLCAKYILARHATPREKRKWGTLLNCGIIGGHRTIFRCVIDDMVTLLSRSADPVCDMAALSAIAVCARPRSCDSHASSSAPFRRDCIASSPSIIVGDTHSVSRHTCPRVLWRRAVSSFVHGAPASLTGGALWNVRRCRR
jgi:hypothetical protein